jgi:hypothetical protein
MKTLSPIPRLVMLVCLPSIMSCWRRGIQLTPVLGAERMAQLPHHHTGWKSAPSGEFVKGESQIAMSSNSQVQYLLLTIGGS